MSGRRQDRSSVRTKSRRSTRHRRGPTQASRSAANVLIFERRVLIGVTLFTLIGTVFWIVAISTDYWYSVTVPDEHGIYVNHTNSYLIRSDVGLWRACRTHRAVSNETGEIGDPITKCVAHQMFPSRKEVAKKQGHIDHTILDFTRTETAFAIIAIILMIMGHGFSFYTFIEQRYMFKRLAGGIHFITAATVVVVVEVLNNAAKYAEQNLKARHPIGSSWHFGYSFVLAWITFITYLVAGIAFLACSRKRKHLSGVSGLHGIVADDPHILGR